jgi:hypothetical protein
MGNPNLPETWTNFQATIPANVEVRSSDHRFRHSTKFIKFLILGNYNVRNESAPLAKFGLDDIALVCTSDFQGNTSDNVPLAKKSPADVTYAQEFIEITTSDSTLLGSLSNDGALSVKGEIIEE